KPELRQVQGRLLAGLLNRIPVHEAAHGFVKGRSVLSHAREHTGQEVVIAYDLREFFNSVGIARICAVWRTLGYAESTAAALAALTTARTPQGVRERLLDAGGLDRDGARRLASPHLPQGAPTSPALANLCAFGLDLRLEGLAWRFGARYSRYADDIVFSGPSPLGRDRRALHGWVQAIAGAEGFVLHPRKTREMPQHCRQLVTGIVVNERPNLERGAYDRLRAQLHGLAATGCDGQTRARLQGQVSWAAQLVAASRADKLRKMLAAVLVR
ncbi:MAG: reverse transcriptase family protein, partial [Ramlibacter sp.]